MKTLLIMRHAKSSWDNARLSDHDRPLNSRGHRDAPRMGRHLKEVGLTPDLVITSSAERAMSTAEAVALACGYEGEIMVTRGFYHADPEDYLEVLSQLDADADTLLIVGHNPGMEELLEELTGFSERLPTAAVARVSLGIGDWAELSFDAEAELTNLWLVRALPPD